MEKFKHLDMDERYTIENGLGRGKSINEIAKILNRSTSSISREIKRNSIIKGINRKRFCNKVVCNGCARRKYCAQKKIYYDANASRIYYRTRLKETRMGPYVEQEKLDYINEILKEKIVHLNHSIHMVMTYDKKLRSMTSEASIRRYIDKGYLDVKNKDLKSKKSRKKINISSKFSAEYLTEERAKMRFCRTFGYFQKYMLLNPNASVVEFDSVIGKRSDKHAILTIYFKKYGVQIGLLINKGDPYSVVNVVTNLFEKLGKDTVKTLFEVCICDNGSEFSTFPKIECDENGEKIINTFYTRPNISTDKAQCERNHRELREILPKHKTLDGLNQKDLNEIFSQLNSKLRKKLNDKTPAALMEKALGKTVLNQLKIKRIPRKKVRLSALI